MNSSKSGAPGELGASFVRGDFDPVDRLAIVLLQRRTDAVIQRLASAEQIEARDFQDWLRFQNAQRFEVYVSMNALHAKAHGRTKQDVETIRHVYLDFDENGTATVEALLKRPDVPKPNHLVSTSPDKWQVVWRVDGFEKTQAEVLQRGLARESGADPAATDCARVLRLPGFYNHKYAPPHLVRAQTLAAETYRPEHFPKFSVEERTDRHALHQRVRSPGTPSSAISQSEKDWAYARRALARGDSPTLVAAAIAVYRRYDKHDPKYYAELTVEKAMTALRAESSAPDGPERS